MHYPNVKFLSLKQDLDQLIQYLDRRVVSNVEPRRWEPLSHQARHHVYHLLERKFRCDDPPVARNECKDLQKGV